MDIVSRCTCGGTCNLNVGDSIQSGVYRWYISYHCSKCNKNTEIDGCGIDTIPDDVQEMIIDQEGEWGLRSSVNKIKIKFLLKKLLEDYNKIILQEDFLRFGTKNQLQWIKNKLVEKGIAENDMEIRKIQIS